MKRRSDTNMVHHNMVSWFHPFLLVKLAWQVVVSALFGRYADHRVTQSLLDNASDKKLLERSDLQKKTWPNITPSIIPDEDGAIWIDYVADLGEGFNSTYAIAYLLAQEKLNIEGAGKPLQRGDVLIMGGDLVYPTASSDTYRERMRDPYEAACPNGNAEIRKPRLFTIPGNHDWYDGLEAFNRIFCSFQDLPSKPAHGGLGIGLWRCQQTRSYFAIKLAGKENPKGKNYDPFAEDEVWLWGLDIQLKGYVDRPQENYFRKMADMLGPNARVIVCTAQPSWLKAEDSKDQAYANLNHILSRVKERNGNQNVFLLIAGDIHHYSRYVEPTGDPKTETERHFITSGGGGAFLHPTHQLMDKISANLLGDDVELALAEDPQSGSKACYPNKNTSRSLLWRNFSFVKNNWQFCLALGAIFGLLANMIEIAKARTLHSGLDLIYWLATSFTSTSTILVAGFVLIIMCLYADTSNWVGKLAIGLVHASLHLTILFGLTAFFIQLNASYLPMLDIQFLSQLILFVEVGIFSALLAGFIWGLYLFVTCKWLHIHTNDGFSAMQIADYKNFLRIRIKDGEVTIYPIGLKCIPGDEDWVCAQTGASNGKPNHVLPITKLEPHLIEAPIVIDPPVTYFKTSAGKKMPV